jgi:hypothetical protein
MGYYLYTLYRQTTEMMMNKMRELYRVLCNDLVGYRFDEHSDMEGFVIRDPKTNIAMATVYCAPNGFSSYEAVMDQTGYDLADERPLALNVGVFRAVAVLKRICSPTMPMLRERHEGIHDELCSFWN